MCVFPCDAIGPGLRAELESVQAEWGAGAAAEAAEAGGAPRVLPCPWGSFDAVLVLFMASALAPEDHPRVFAAAAAALRPGGTLLFRDYGAYDEAELRFRPGSRLGPHLFLRGDGTLAAFFSLPGIRALAAGAGLEVAAARYIFRRQRNRGQGTEMRRVFVQVRGEGGLGALSYGAAALFSSLSPPCWYRRSCGGPTLLVTPIFWRRRSWEAAPWAEGCNGMS